MRVIGGGGATTPSTTTPVDDAAALAALRGAVDDAIDGDNSDVAQSSFDDADALIANGSPRTAARAAYQRARLSEVFGTMNEALAGYAHSLELDPSAPTARDARRRMRALEREVDAGDDDEVRRAFDRARRVVVDDPSAYDDVLALRDRATSASQRAEIDIWLAGHETHRLDDAPTAWARLADLLTDPEQSEDVQRLAIDALAGLSGRASKFDETRRLFDRYFADHPELLDDLLVRQVYDEIVDQRQRAFMDAFTVVSFTALIALFGWGRGWRGLHPARWRPWQPWRGGLLIVWLFGGAAVISEAWHVGHLYVIASCIPGVLVVHVLVAGIVRAEQGPTPPAWRGTLLAVAGCATLAAIYLTLRWSQKSLLLGW